jgi:hypothetical protein
MPEIYKKSLRNLKSLHVSSTEAMEFLRLQKAKILRPRSGGTLRLESVNFRHSSNCVSCQAYFELMAAREFDFSSWHLEWSRPFSYKQ